jgi:hypothetical protein
MPLHFLPIKFIGPFVHGRKYFLKMIDYEFIVWIVVEAKIEDVIVDVDQPLIK